MSPFEFLIAALAVFRLTRLVVSDTIFDPLRDRVEAVLTARSNRSWAAWVLDLISCPWCVSVHMSWIGLAAALITGVIDPGEFSSPATAVVWFVTWWMALAAGATVVAVVVDRLTR